jgi:DNA-binding IclR family transcriptional regulator
VLGRVLELDIVSKQLPLLFFKGGYGRFSPASMAALDSPVISQSQLQLVNRARHVMETLSSELAACCLATVRTGTELIVAASAGTPKQDLAPTLGQRLPFRPPTGAIFAAWLPVHEAERWCDVGSNDARKAEYRTQLHTVRERGYSVGLLNDAQRAFLRKLGQITNQSYESHHAELQQLIGALAYDPLELSPQDRATVRLISVPIFDNHGQVIMAFTLHSFRKPGSNEDILKYIAQLRAAAQSATKAIGGRDPTITH